MADSTFNLFGPITGQDIRVGYISTDRGYIQGIDVCAANVHAQKNPGEVFIYKPKKDIVQFLNINQVNKLREDPDIASEDKSCPDGLDMTAESDRQVRAEFMGGGGVGVVANPVVSPEGRIMALHMVHAGFGYQYPPIVHIHDESNIGAGAVVRVGVGTTYSKVEYYTDKEDFEEYQLCENLFTDPSKIDGGIESKIAGKRSPYGRRWSPSGKDLGPWRPQSYMGEGKPPFSDVIDEYIKKLNESGKDWFTTRKKPPLKITSEGKTTKEFHKVEHWTWGPGTKTALSIVPFEILWSSPHRTKGLGFEFTAEDGSHSFRIVDTSGKGSGKRVDSYQVKENVTYNVKPIGKRPSKKATVKSGRGGRDKITELAEIGLLKKLGFGGGRADPNKLDANKEGTGDKIFADFLDTLDDADDLQIQAKRGKFTAFNPRWVQGVRKRRKTFDLTYRLETGKEVIAPGFMNSYAISPKPPSNIKGSDFAGHWFTFEWDLDFPYDGEYVIRTARDNRSRIYFDNVSYTDKLQTFTGTNPEGGKVGPRGGYGNKITFKKGPKKLKLELYNDPHMGLVIDQQAPPPSTSDINFHISSGSMFSNGVTIEGLNIDEVKPFTPVGMGKKGQLNVTHTRKIEYGKKYKVVFTSKTTGIGGVLGGIKYTGLKEGGLRRARSTRLEFDDNPSNGFDVNASFTVDRGKAKFSADGRTLEGRGDVTLTLSWNDNPNISGRALNKIEVGGKTWTITSSQTGSETHTIDLGRKFGAVTPRIRLRTTEPNIIQMEDWTDNDWTDIIVTASGGQFTDIRDNIAYFSVAYPPPQVGRSSGDDRKTVEVFNTVDYINRASRRLWRTNVYDRGGFLNEYGICPFDSNIQLKDNPYAGVHRIAWPNVNFPHSGNYDIQVAVDDNVKLTIGDQATIDKRGFIEGTSISTGVLRLTRYIKAGRHTITADLEQIPGGAYGFRHVDTKKVNKSEIKFNVKGNSYYTNTITIPGLFSFTKKSKVLADKTFINQVEEEKEYDVIFSSIEGNPRLRIRDKGRRVEMEDLNDNQSWDDLVCSVNNGEFYNVQGNRCKFRTDRSIKGNNPMALAINIESTYTQKKALTPTSWNENPMGVALTIEAPAPPIPQQSVPKAEGTRCPNNPYWTTRFPGAKERWYPVRLDGWGQLLNENGISPLPPYNKHINPVVDVSFEVFWSSPHRKKGLGYRFTAQDGSHSFSIIDTGRTHDGSKTESHKVKVNTTYNVKAIGQRTAAQGSRIGPDALGGHDNSKVIELAEQGLLKASLGVKGGRAEGTANKLDANRTGTGDKIFADFLDTLDDSDDLQIQAGAGQFTASNPRMVHALRGKRKTYDLTYKLKEVPPNDAGNFTNTWTKSFEFGGYYKALLEADDIGELWIDDKKVLWTDRRKDKTYDEKLIWIDGPTSKEDFDKNGPTNHNIKIVVENYKSEKLKTINAKVFDTLDWIGGSSAKKAQKKIIQFKINSLSMFGNSIKIPELDISESKEYKGSQLNVTREREVEVNKVYNVEFSSTNQALLTGRPIKYVGLNASNDPIKVRRNGKRIELLDGGGTDVNSSLTIDSGSVKFSPDGKKLMVSGREAKITFDWNDNINIAGRSVQSIQIGDQVWRITKEKTGSITKIVKFPRNSDNTSNIKLKNDGESVVRMEDWTDTSWDDLVCAATEGRFFDFNGNKCKFMVGSSTRVSGATGSGTTRDGITYQGPHLFHYIDSRWGKVLNREGISPIGSPTQSLSDPNDNIAGKKILVWKNVDFPKTGKYQMNLVADNWADLFIDEKKVLSVRNNFKDDVYNIDNIDVGKGKHDIKVELTNGTASNVFLKDPTGVALRIYTRMVVGTGIYRSWRENPVGVSAKLIPPPCPKPSKGKGTVVDPIVIDGGNRYQPSPEPLDPGSPGTYPVRLKMKEPIIIDTGINYNCAEDTIRVEPSNGVKLSLCQCGPFGRVEKVCIEYEGGPDGGNGYFTEPPRIIVDSPTGVNLELALQFEPVIVPFDIPDVIQVTDLVGLKQTGYYKGKPYYGAVFYENGVKYSGWYKTAGEMIQVYDTMQESIDAEVTTPPSAIQRQGSDPGGNDPRLNIPGTPENLI